MHSAFDREAVPSSALPARRRVPRERPQPEVRQPELPRPGQHPVRRPEAGRRDVPADRLAHPYREAVRPAYAAAAQSPDFHRQEGSPSELWPSEARAVASLRVPAWRREAAEAAVSSVASAPRVLSSLRGAAVVGVAAYVRAVPPWVEPVGSDAREQAAEAAREAWGARAQPREAAVAEFGAEPAAAEGEPDAEPAEEVGAAEPDAALQPGVVAAAVRDAVLQPGAAARDAVLRRAADPSVAAPSAFHRGQALPWLAPRRAAQFAHAMRKSRAVQPSERWWPAAGCEGLS